MKPNVAMLPLLVLSLFTPAVGFATPDPDPSPDPTPPAVSPAADPSLGGAVALPPAAVPTPVLVRSAEAQARHGTERVEVTARAGDTSDSPEVTEEVEADSADMEDVRQAEESAHLGDAAESSGQPAGASVSGGHIALLPEMDRDLDALRAEYDIPIDVNPAVVAYVRFFQSPVARAHFVRWLGRASRYEERYRQILKEEGLPSDTLYLAMIESGFGNFAYSRARASGPWQFIAGTGKIFGLKQDFWVDERRDPERSARAAARYLKKLYEQTGDWRLAWAGYNAGVGRVLAAQRKGYTDFWSMAAAPGKRVLRPETKGYVPKLMAAAIIAKHPEAFGFRQEEIDRQSWTDYQEVEIPSATLLSVVARAAGVEERDLVDLNPELRRSCTPPRTYPLKIPAASAPAFTEAWPALSAKVRTTFAGHVIKKGDTIGRIAVQYGVPAQGILEMNNLRDGRRLRVGTELLIPRPMAGGAGVAAAQLPEVERKRPAAAPRAVPASAVAASRGAGRTLLRVHAGDTLWSISQRLGVELDDLCRWNGIKSPDRYKLVAGRRLVVLGERG
jgi:membrane-bound lytic murein transglycosylase D